MLSVLTGPQQLNTGTAVVVPVDVDGNQMEIIQKHIAILMHCSQLQEEINTALNFMEVLLFQIHLEEETGLLQDVANAGKLKDQMAKLLYWRELIIAHQTMMFATTNPTLILPYQLLIMQEQVFQMCATELNQENQHFIHPNHAQVEEAQIQIAAINSMTQYWETVAITSFH